jgi:hypothetical protein
MLVFLASQVVEIRQIVVQSQMRHNSRTLYGKYPTQNRGRKVVQVVECPLALASKYSTLSSTPVGQKKLKTQSHKIETQSQF